MAKFPFLALVPPFAFIGLAGVFYWGMQREDPDALPSTFVGEEAPDLAPAPLGDLPMVSRADLDAEGVKLVNFWASWCAPCRVEHPNLEALAMDGVTIHGVNYKDQPDNALGFLSDLGNPYTAVGADRDGRSGRDWGLYGVPETFVVDGEGTVVLRFAGPITDSVLENRIRPAIEEARGPE